MGWSHLVVRARAGDRDALADLARSSLPLVYTVVRRALGPDPAVDDVVQDVLVRMLRQLPQLRTPERFRSWLIAIALHRIGTHLKRAGVAVARTAPLDELAGEPDVPFEDLSLLRVELASQRRQVMHAGQWLDAGHRTLLPLWVLLTTGDLTRAEIADALGTSDAHAGVRLQRMRDQLELCRSIVVALEAEPGCERLSAVLADWDGTPGVLWRKRIGRHVRSCDVCRAAASGLVATERLLAGLALLPVPAALAAAILTKQAPAVAPIALHPFAGSLTASGFGGRLAVAAGLHPVAGAVATAVLAAVVAVTAIGLADPAQRVSAAANPAPPTGSSGASTPAPLSGPPATAPAAAVPLDPSTTPTTPARPTGPTLRLGRLSLEPVDVPGRFLTLAGDRGVLGTDRAGSTFEAVPGLSDPACFSFRSGADRFLRHSSWRLRADRDDGTVLFRRDATFCVRPGARAGSVALESANYPRYFVRLVGDEFWVDESDGGMQFRSSSSFKIRPTRP
ncbi:sigma-70 family RNA polymerase sigma factor [Actinoplanes sp. NPDC051633]|uniref:sigma-70 family RNA polymerase sigma factor n=1 Tax=Actinoplanes sp. NPDC051633 TaxID=3155670 RepID=UPI00341273DC